MQRIVQSTASFSAAMEEKWPGSIVVLLITPVMSKTVNPVLYGYKAKITIYSSEDFVEENRLAGPIKGRSESCRGTQEAVSAAAMTLLHVEGIDAAYQSSELTWRFRI
ncbi:MAG: hypothetical protein WC052_04330 [Patescibacteria group bacterium]